MRVVATIEARMASERLPGKVLLPAVGEPLLAHLLRRVQRVPGIDEVIVATTDGAGDDPIVDCARECLAGVFRGSEDDVLGRVVMAVREARADVVVALTGDNPIIDPIVIEMVLAAHRKGGADITASTFERTFPVGMSVQVADVGALIASQTMAEDAKDREHLTRVLRRRDDVFAHRSVVAPPEMTCPELSVTVDEEPDYELVRRIIERLAPANPAFGCADVIALVRSEPELLAINAAVGRRF